MFMWLNIVKALVVRCVLIFHVLLCTWRVTINLDNQMYWFLLLLLLPLICESFYTITRRHGREFFRFTPCFFFYLGAVLPGIWLLELDMSDRYIEGAGQQNQPTSDPTDILIPGRRQSIWLVVIEEMLPYVIFICRWILPRGQVTREQLSELLFSFIEIGADIMEFFSLFGEDVIRGNKSLAYCVLAIWTFSLLQFTMTLTVTHQPKSENTVRVMEVQSQQDQEWTRIQREIFAIFVTMFMQDLPFAIMRLYTIVKFNRITYSLIFFTSKNLLIIVLLLYKIAVLLKKRHYPDPEDADDEVEIMQNESRESRGRRSGRQNGVRGSLSQFSVNIDKDPIFSTNRHKLHDYNNFDTRREDDTKPVTYNNGKTVQDRNGDTRRTRPPPKPHRTLDNISPDLSTSWFNSASTPRIESKNHRNRPLGNLHEQFSKSDTEMTSTSDRTRRNHATSQSPSNTEDNLPRSYPSQSSRTSPSSWSKTVENGDSHVTRYVRQREPNVNETKEDRRLENADSNLSPRPGLMSRNDPDQLRLSSQQKPNHSQQTADASRSKRNRKDINMRRSAGDARTESTV